MCFADFGLKALGSRVSGFQGLAFRLRGCEGLEPGLEAERAGVDPERKCLEFLLNSSLWKGIGCDKQPRRPSWLTRAAGYQHDDFTRELGRMFNLTNTETDRQDTRATCHVKRFCRLFDEADMCPQITLSRAWQYVQQRPSS